VTTPAHAAVALPGVEEAMRWRERTCHAMIVGMTSHTLSFAVRPTLIGEKVLLRPVAVTDTPGLVELLNEPDVRRLTGTHTRVPPEMERERAEQWYSSRAEQDDRLDLAIVEQTTGGYVGEVVLNELDVDNRSCGFRIALVGPRTFSRGYGTEATRLILAHAFDAVGVHRVELEVFAFNPRARHVYEQVGFVHEGTKRQALQWQGEWVDSHLMAILAEDWFTHRGRRRF
jgi:RimJ/RimL family protein N-acetyltransferase